MLRVLAFLPQAVLIGLVVYTLAVSVAGWRTPVPPRPSSPRRRLLVVIPAHDEERVVAHVVGDLRANRYPSELVDLWVLADRCSDGTARVARERGAQVAERDEGSGGKGAALSWFLEHHPLPGNAALVVIDADNRVSPELLGRLAGELESGAEVVQVYIDTTRPDESWLTRASALSYWAGNRMVQLARSNLGWSVDLGGTGMCLTSPALEAVGGFGESLVEDQELAVRLALAGIRVAWVHDERIRDEKPASTRVIVRQRARWAAGRREVARRHVGALLRAAWSGRRWSLVDQALRLVQPSRTVVALVSAALAVLAAVVGSAWLITWWVWAGLAMLQFVAPVPFLIRDGVPLRLVVWYPVMVVLAVLWLPIQVVSRRSRSWYHTPHRGEIADESGAGDESSG